MINFGLVLTIVFYVAKHTSLLFSRQNRGVKHPTPTPPLMGLCPQAAPRPQKPVLCFQVTPKREAEGFSPFRGLWTELWHPALQRPCQWGVRRPQRVLEVTGMGCSLELLLSAGPRGRQPSVEGGGSTWRALGLLCLVQVVQRICETMWQDSVLST